MNIDFELYKIFYFVAKNLNVTKASKELKISQPAVTKHIKNLEEQLSCTLFIRTKRGVYLTETGKIIYENIKKGVEDFYNVENILNNVKVLKQGSLGIGINTTLTKVFLLPYLSKFHDLYPNINITIITDATEDNKKKLKNGEIDIVFGKIMKNDEKKFNVQNMGTLSYCFIAGHKYENLKNKKISPDELNNYPILLQTETSTVRKIFDALCTTNNLEIHSIMDIASSNLLINFVKSGFGIGFATKEYARGYIDNKKVFEIDVDLELPINHFGVFLLKETTPTFAVKELLKIIEKGH